MPERKKALCQKEALCHKENGDEGTTNTTTANQVATTPRTLRGGGWTGMLGGTSGPTIHEHEPDRDGDFEEGGAAPPHRPRRTRSRIRDPVTVRVTTSRR